MVVWWLIADTHVVSSAVQLAWISENAGRPFADVEGQGDLSGPGPVKKSLTFNLKASHLGALGVFIFEPCCTQLESNLSQPTAVLHRVNPIYSQAFKDMYWLQLEDRIYIYVYIYCQDRIRQECRNFDTRIELLWVRNPDGVWMYLAIDLLVACWHAD